MNACLKTSSHCKLFTCPTTNTCQDVIKLCFWWTRIHLLTYLSHLIIVTSFVCIQTVGQTFLLPHRTLRLLLKAHGRENAIEQPAYKHTGAREGSYNTLNRKGDPGRGIDHWRHWLIWIEPVEGDHWHIAHSLWRPGFILPRNAGLRVERPLEAIFVFWAGGRRPNPWVFWEKVCSLYPENWDTVHLHWWELDCRNFTPVMFWLM